MNGSRRILIEVVLVLVLVGLVAGVWWWKDRSCARELGERDTAHAAELADLRAAAEAWAGALADSEAEATFRAFMAGIGPDILGGRADSVDLAVGALLELPAIDFVHVLRPDGSVIASSDRKLITAGRVGEEGRWALAATAIATRASERRGMTEIASPITTGDGPRAFVWVAYATEMVREELRPAEI